ncbi:hypothetical protein V5N11_035212 [Cardamine amara subsp. amara]|uniref:Reverse transcriptase zinc-binding domain-containing protein n=1 Tax=Cardamine amara subsp. amara TaxID=228776 RepID=A0ABD1C6K9_CARAN
MVNGMHKWDIERVRQVVDPLDVEIVLGIKLNGRDERGYLGWHYTEEGVYTVKSGYWLATHLATKKIPINPPAGNLEIKQSIWKLNAAPKLNHLLWRMMENALATGTILGRHNITVDATCKRCCQEDESIHHLFFMCPYAQSISRGANISHRILLDPLVDLNTKIKSIGECNHIKRIPSLLNQLPIWILWRIWKSRNI